MGRLKLCCYSALKRHVNLEMSPTIYQQSHVQGMQLAWRGAALQVSWNAKCSICTDGERLVSTRAAYIP